MIDPRIHPVDAYEQFLRGMGVNVDSGRAREQLEEMRKSCDGPVSVETWAFLTGADGTLV